MCSFHRKEEDETETPGEENDAGPWSPADDAQRDTDKVETWGKLQQLGARNNHTVQAAMPAAADVEPSIFCDVFGVDIARASEDDDEAERIFSLDEITDRLKGSALLVSQ